MLPDLPLLLAFLAASVALIMSPGPDSLYVMSRSIGQGRLAGSVAALGTIVGLAVHVLAAAFGLGHFFALAPIAFEVVRFAGAAYLLWLAWECFRPQPAAATSSDSDDGEHTPQREKSLPLARIFRQAILTNVLNPKVALFFIAFLPQFLPVRATDATASGSLFSATLPILALGAIFISLTICWLLAVAQIVGLAADRLRRSPRVERIQRYVMGSILGALGLTVALRRG